VGGHGRQGLAILVLSALALIPIASPRALLGQAATDATALAARIQARQATIHDFTANFSETVSSPLLPSTSKDEGEIKIKKPGRLRMTYRTGDRNVYVADGKMLYSHFVPDGYVTQSPLPNPDQAPTWLSFLSGRGDLARDFTARLAEPQPQGEWRLILTPRQPQADFASLTLDVDRQSLQLRGLAVLNTQRTTNTYRFSNMRENVGVPDQEFIFQVPRGVVIKKS
jgi:outer membrane lipoprotein carrier protein